MVYDREHYIQKQIFEVMQQQEKQSNPDFLPQEEISPVGYLHTVIDLYRQDEADYRGRRNEDQELIAELAAEEADEYFDKALISVMDFHKLANPGVRSEVVVKPDEATEAEITLGGLKDGVSLRDMRNSWRQLWVGMSVITNRLKRDSSEFQTSGLQELFDMDGKNKGHVMDSLFSNFQDLNALRFGAKGSGVQRTKIIPNMDGGEPRRVRVDADKAETDIGVANNAARRKYNATREDSRGPGAMHPAGKMFPEEFTQLRKEHPQVDMEHFAHDVAYMKNVGQFYEEHQE